MAFNLGQGLTGAGGGALSGAGTGAMIGSMFGPGPGTGIGAGIGAGVGGLSGLLGGGLSKSRESQKGALSLYDPQVQSQLNDVLSGILSRYQSGELGGSFEPIAAQAREGFKSKTLPSIMERLTDMGAGGGRSNASVNVPAQAGVDLELGLASQGAQFGQQQEKLLQNLLGLGQGSPFYQQGGPSQFENVLSQILGATGQAAGGYLSGPGFAFKNNPEIGKLFTQKGGTANG